MSQRVFIASDHAGFETKMAVVEFLKSKKIKAIDLGTDSAENSVDFPDFANLLSQKLKAGSADELVKDFGILICGSGQGMAMRANKFSWIRAALCWSLESAKLSREHNDANVLCFGARLIELPLCLEMVEAFLATSFAGGRHQARVVKIGLPG